MSNLAFLVDNHSILGETPLPRTLASLFTLALHGSPIPSDKYTSVILELLRLAANLCMDHDENRGRLLDSGFPQAVASLLEGYAENILPLPHKRPFDLSIPHLKIVKTSIGAILNASIGYDPVKLRLASLEAPLTILKLSTAIYPTGVWSNVPAEHVDSILHHKDEWILRSCISSWAWRAVTELRDVKDDTLPLITADYLPLLVQPLSAFIPDASQPAELSFEQEIELVRDLIDTDLNNLEESSMLIESLALDVDEIRLSLGRGLHSHAEHGDIPCLSIILDFIENGTYPSSWSFAITDEKERKQNEKTFNICKGALIKSVVEVAGEDKNGDILWDDSKPETPGGNFVFRMVDWLKRYVEDLDATSRHTPDVSSLSDREDMVICASLSLGNLARRETNSTALVSPPYSLVPVLASHHLLSPSTDIKVKHGVIALLKHLAQGSSFTIQSALGKAGIIRHIAASGIWEKGDAMVDVVQLSAIGLVKHMANANGNAGSLLKEVSLTLSQLSIRSPNSPTAFSQVLALVQRTDSIPVRSEGSRVLVNVVRSLWGSKVPAIDTSESGSTGTVDQTVQEQQRKHNAALRTIVTSENASILARLIGTSGKYPLLINEGLVALTMFSIPKEGASFALDALLVPLSNEIPLESPFDPTSPLTTASDISPTTSPTKARVRLNIPRHPLDMLIFILKNVDNPANYPVEVRANVCSLFIELSRHGQKDKLEQVKEAVQPILEDLLASHALGDKLESVMRRLHEMWL
ncbi:hypothetical protein H0H92_002644 [Tricholoma furcatifolium]|nr:hypothetical protein H0H92_002644 [Tricholoma furcatifolium]